MGLAYPLYVKDAVPVIAAFLESPEPLLRERAVNALGRIGRGDYSLIEPYWAGLFRFASDEEAKVRLSFVWASENIATNTPDIYADHIPVFEELLHDADDKVRMEAPEIFRVLGKRRPEFVNGSMSALDYSSRKIVAADLIIKAVGIILAIFVYPPITMFAVILAGCVVTFLPHIVNRKNKKRGEIDAV